jgi:hypothetical protein
MNNITNVFSAFESTARRTLETAHRIARLHIAVPPQTQPRPVALQPAATSLTVLVRNVRRGHRCEDVAWMVLAGSALVLLALSLWL